MLVYAWSEVAALVGSLFTLACARHLIQIHRSDRTDRTDHHGGGESFLAPPLVEGHGDEDGRRWEGWAPPRVPVEQGYLSPEGGYDSLLRDDGDGARALRRRRWWQRKCSVFWFIAMVSGGLGFFLQLLVYALGGRLPRCARDWSLDGGSTASDCCFTPQMDYASAQPGEWST